MNERQDAKTARKRMRRGQRVEGGGWRNGFPARPSTLDLLPSILSSSFSWRLGVLAFIFNVIAVGPVPADELRLAARELLDKSVAQNLRLSDDGNSIDLESGELFEDDGP